MLDEMRTSLERFGVHFDVWFSEKTPARRRRGRARPRRAAQAGPRVRGRRRHLAAHHRLHRRQGPGADPRATARRRTSPPTAAYYINKRERGFDKCIYLLGADHHGYVNRLKAIAACAGDDPDFNIEILIGQLVSLVQGGEPVKLSKRAGTLITLDEIVDAVGVDAARYSLARSSTDSPLTLDLDEITRSSNDNPVHYVRYAHARIASLLRNAAELGRDPGRGLRPGPALPRAGERPAQGARRVPGRGGHRRRTARAAPDRALPRGPGRARTTASTTPAGCCRRATSRRPT